MRSAYKKLEFTDKLVDVDVVQELIKKDLVDAFVLCLVDPVEYRQQFTTQFLDTNQSEAIDPEQYIVVTGDMYGIVVPSTRLFYGTLAELIGVVFILKSQPIGSALFTCIGSENNINAFRYLFQSVRHQENREWSSYNSEQGRPGFGLFGWIEWHTNKINKLRKELLDGLVLEHHETKQVRRWYRQHLSKSKQRKLNE